VVTRAVDSPPASSRWSCRLHDSVFNVAAPICHGHHKAAPVTLNCGKSLGKKSTRRVWSGCREICCETATSLPSERASVQETSAAKAGVGAELTALTLMVMEMSESEGGVGGAGVRGDVVRDGADKDSEDC